MDSSNILTQAERFCKSYAEATALGQTSSQATTADVAKAIAGHYSRECFVTFCLGKRYEFKNRDDGFTAVKGYLDNYLKHGIGLDIRMDRCHVKSVSSSSALCFITWSIHPPADGGIKPWDFENVYAFRTVSGQQGGHFEFVVSDNEMETLGMRVPRFFESM